MFTDHAPSKASHALAATLPGRRPVASDPRRFASEIGACLRRAFSASAAVPLSPRFAALLASLGSGEPAPHDNRVHDEEFKRDLAALIPQLRAFGRSLSNSADIADDLVQETMLKAWTARDSFARGSSLRAWTYVILRNVYFSQTRRAKFKGEWNEFSADILLAQPATQDHHVALQDLQRALSQLPIDQREAVILMGAGGMSCDEVAEICGCPVGTVKSRVSRGRATLKALLEGGQLASTRASQPTTSQSALDAIMQQAHLLTHPLASTAQPALA